MDNVKVYRLLDAEVCDNILSNHLWPVGDGVLQDSDEEGSKEGLLRLSSRGTASLIFSSGARSLAFPLSRYISAEIYSSKVS